MKTVFIKSGGYYETPGVSIIGAINDVYGVEVRQFNKLEAAFRLDLVNFEYRIYPPAVGAGDLPYFKVDMERLTQIADECGFAHVGVVGHEDALVSPREVLRNLAVVVIDPATKKYKDTLNGEILEGNNVTPLLFFVKMTTDTYALVMSKLIAPTSRLENYNKPAPPGLNKIMRIIAVNDGESMRDKYIGVEFTNAVKHFRNNDLVTGYAVFVRQGAEVTLDLFKNSPCVTDEFKKNFTVEVQSSFDGVKVASDGKVTFTAPKYAITGYLCVKFAVTPLYADISSREIKELLSFDFTVAVI